MCSDIAIEAQHLSKCYRIYEKPHERLLQLFLRDKKHYGREFWALKDVSFKIKKGETVGIIGRNGSGKSTLLQLICGTLNPTSGDLKTQGRISALLELGSGFNPEFTGRENIFMNASVLGLTQEEIIRRFDEIVAFADIGDFIEQPVKTYSTGMMVRLAFAVISHVDADILIIDEALAVGDAFFIQKCMRFLRDFMKTGTLLFTSHDTGSIKNLCNHAIWLEKGQIMKEGTPKEVCERYLEAFYESQQGKSTHEKLKLPKPSPEMPLKDQRLDFINASNLRNDIKVFQFDPDAASFGKGGAKIIAAHLTNELREPLAWIVGGEKIILHVIAKMYQALSSPIIGFFIKDKLGQSLFGDNSFLTYYKSPLNCEANSELHAFFSFYMPILPAGDYSITISIASGTQTLHVQHHWIHDAILFRSESSSVSTGLVGIPMHEIKLQTQL